MGTDRPQVVPAARRFTRWSLRHGVVRVGAARAARSGDLHSQFMTDGRYRTDPFPYYERVRERGTLVRGRLGAVTADHAVTQQLLRSDAWRSRPDEQAMPWPVRRLLEWSRDPQALGALDPPSMLVLDPPDHARYRRLASRVFTARAVAALGDRVQQIADELLDELAGDETVDLVSAYAARLPTAVICEILGVPSEDHDRVARFGMASAPDLDFGIDYRRYRGVDDAIRGFTTWLGLHLQRLRETPGDDLLSQLVHLEEDGRRLSDTELRVTALLLLAAGVETTVRLLGSGAELLLGHPDQRALLDADPSLWPNAVEEVLRVGGPVQLTGRFSSRDTELGGHPVAKGTLVLAYVAGANRDPQVFGADAARFDVRRANAPEHLAFSSGRHFCLGAALARLEGEIGLRSLFQRYPDLALAGPGRRTTTTLLHGWESLPVRTQA